MHAAPPPFPTRTPLRLQPAQLARAGDSADITIAGVEANVCFPGCMLCPPAWLPRIATRVEARVLVLDVPIPILKGQQVIKERPGVSVARE